MVKYKDISIIEYDAQHKSANTLVFIAAGDFNRLDALLPEIEFAYVCVAYYGESRSAWNSIRSRSDMAVWARGTKFNLLKKIVDEALIDLEQFEACWILDDDLVLTAGNCSQFVDEFQRSYLKIASPSHSASGKISHPIMISRPPYLSWRVTNFVEMTCPIFKSDFLVEFIHDYDGSLDGWGCDWWFLNMVDGEVSPYVGISDHITFVNPPVRPDGKRSIEQSSSNELRAELWNIARGSRGFREWKHESLGYI